MNVKELIKQARHPKNWKTLYKEHKEIVNYIIFGVGTTIVSYIAYYLFRWLFPDAKSVPGFLNWVFNLTAVFGKESNTTLPVFLSWICSVTFAYITNRIWVFESKAKGFLNVTREVLSFAAARILTLLIDILIMFLLVDLPQISNPWYELLVAKTVSSVFVLVLNYVFSKLFVFRKKKSAEAAAEENVSESDSEDR